jgi:hypothetical protein
VVRAPILTALLVAAAGCGGPSPDGEAVSGRVAFRGEPLADGVVSFVPAEGKLPPVMARVARGTFRLHTRPGAYRVEVSASREKAGPNTSGMKAGPREEVIPERYNRRSTLAATVTAGGPNDFAFDLTD